MTPRTFTPGGVKLRGEDGLLVGELTVGEKVLLEGFVTEHRQPRIDVTTFGEGAKRTLPLADEYVVDLTNVRPVSSRPEKLRTEARLNETTIYGFPAESVRQLIDEAQREGRL